MRTFDGHQLDVRTYGPDDARLTVALAHCWAVNQEEWVYQLRDLQREFGHAIRIVTWDHRGHGRSDKPSRHACTIENMARDMADVLETFATGKVVLAGHSVGGMTLLALAEQRPELFDRVVGVALVATSSGDLDTVTLGLPEMGSWFRRQIPRVLALRSKTLSKRARRRAPYLERFVTRRFLFGHPMRLTDAALTVEGIIGTPAATMVGLYEELMAHSRLHACKVLANIPTDVLVGDRDLLTPIAHAQKLADAIEGARLTVIPDAGHMLPLERDELVSGVLIRMVRPHL